MSFSALKFLSVNLWLLDRFILLAVNLRVYEPFGVALLRLGGTQDVSDNSDLQTFHVPNQGIETATSNGTPAYSRLRRASSGVVTSSCLAPPRPINGQYKLDPCDDDVDCGAFEGTALGPGSRLIYSCNSGYRATGNTNVYCSAKGKWSTIPECIQVKCNSLNSESTMASCTRSGKWVNCDSPVPPGTRAEVACRLGYKKNTNFLTSRRPVVNCNKDGIWEPQPIKCVPVCGRVITQQQPLIYGGTPAQIGDFPWHASLFREKRSSTENEKVFICGGTIIQTNLVLTAAHCVYDEITKTTEDPKKFFVVTGNVFRDYDSPAHNPAIVRKASVKRVYTNCNYYGLIGNYVSDIALLELQQPFEFSSILLPACLDDSGYSDQSLEPGVYGKVAGFGRTATGTTSAILQTITLPYISYSECKTSNNAAENEAFISSDKFCAGYNNGSAVCEGDSGGGLVFKKGELWFVMGIVSVGLGVDIGNGEKTCDKYSYSLYTKVSTYTKWIQDVLFHLDRNEPYPSCNFDSQTTAPSIAQDDTASDNKMSYCSAPPQPTNGEWRLDANHCGGITHCSVREGDLIQTGHHIVYSCAPHFTSDFEVSYCGYDGEWSGTPICTDGPCSLKNGSSGVCTLLKNCQPIMEEKEIGRSSDEGCGSSELEPIVCCPLATPVVGNTSPPVDEVVGDGRGAIARQKCIEYSQYASPSKCPWSDDKELEKDVDGGRRFPKFMEFPHLAAIGFPLGSDIDSVSWDCGGALISEVFVLTSAACIDSKPLGNATLVRVGQVDKSSYEERRIIKRILHPEYKPPSEYHDIGLVRLESPISLDGWIRPACLHTKPSVESQAAITTKWGYTDYATNRGSTAVSRVALPIVDPSICKARWASVTRESNTKRITGSAAPRSTKPQRKLARGVVNDWLICAGATGQLLCQGDPGGALVLHREGKGKELCMYDVVGVMSLTKPCAAQIPALYTRVYNYVPWIESIVWAQG